MRAHAPTQLVLASANAKKLAELQSLLADLAVALVPQGALGVGEAEEPHASFIENALAKARHAAAATGTPALADDSGLCVDALGGAPGVVSAHYAELPLDLLTDLPTDLSLQPREARRRVQDACNNQRLLAELAPWPQAAQRRAHFICTLVAVRHAADPQPLVAVGRWAGVVLPAPHGTGGFGYDPLLLLPELGCTVAELDAPTKNRLSHRALAMAQLHAQLRAVWGL